MTSECSICCDTFTKTRAAVSCANCAAVACSRCIKAYLLSVATEPHCMQCRHIWSRSFLDAHLPHSWLEGDLRRHREKILFDRERSLLPATQPAAEIERQKRIYGEELVPLEHALSDLRQQRAQVKDAIRDGNKERQAEYTALDKEYNSIHSEINLRRRYIQLGSAQAAAGAPETERRQFVAACPVPDCRGFLSTAYKCGTCQGQFCAACREPKAADHVCNPDLVATIQAIVKDSKPCPTCGTAISRVSGCDQMYCIQCDTPFSWASGKRVAGVIHNPHYFERVRHLHGQVPRQPGDHRCGGWPSYWDLPFACHNVFYGTVLQSGIHIEEVVLRDFPVEARPADNQDLRVKYLLQDIDEKGFKQALQRRDRRRSLFLELRGPLELYVVTVLELFVKIMTERRVPSVDALGAFYTFVDTHVNTPLRAIGDRYKNQVPQILLPGGEETPHAYPGVQIYHPNGYKPSLASAKTTSLVPSEA
jgi:hypothetical protein